ncbi:hypothetical protein BTHE68_72030 (plasmid) [Burkholderia sp. THE68]|uniref:eCIS core domain-containing protein n=1 Tax=Burkholderia sp. THE68 TaxID=758782 RepID=UPI00131615B2|nr:DUF4157 domain-containing protein [Burkholderia sp. THE68]BBU33469.1 hypothetical protein BTHE68_72030 [Burkholderia sp. THE68]
MARERSGPARTPAITRRVASSAARRSAAPTNAQALRQRAGIEGAQALLARASAPLPAQVSMRTPVSLQGAHVSHPSDPAEHEARETGRRVVHMGELVQRADVRHDEDGGKHKIQRAVLPARPAPPASTPPAPPVAAAAGTSGAPLPAGVRGFMEARFGANFGQVRIHTDDDAARRSASLDAHAFTVGPHVYFGRDRFRPDNEQGRELIAHELTHTIQQGAASQRRDKPGVAARASTHVQRDLIEIPDPRKYFAEKAANIPGFTMLTVVIGVNPISGAHVERSAGNILKGAIELIPGGAVITDAMNRHGVFASASVWVQEQFDAIKDIAGSVSQDIDGFLHQFKLTDLTDPGDLWNRARGIVDRPIARITAFAIALKDGIVGLIKDAILRPIADFARTTDGYPLLCAVMGKDPITGESVEQDPESLLGAFMKFIGEEEIWDNMQKAKAVPRAFAWFKGAIAALKGFISEIPGLFVQAFHALEVADIILIPRAFAKLAGVFGGFAGRFVTWGATAVWNLLEIVFDSVSPGALSYIKRTGAALRKILRDPLPFVGNLIKAAKEGFLNFAEHFLDHLKAGLIDWLTGSLPGIYIPRAFTLIEIAKFALSVLGLSWANIRQKLVKATSETFVKGLEKGFDIVVALVRDGPVAAWDKIKEQLADLKETVIGGIQDFVVDMVVKRAIPKLIAIFIPGAGFISAIISIYDTVMVFVNKLKSIAQLVASFVDSIINIANGNIGAAVARVEGALASGLSLAINFLAGFAGLGKVADKVMGVFNKVRAPFDKALDWLVGWIAKAANWVKKGAASAVAVGKKVVGKLFNWLAVKTGFKDDKGKSHSILVEEKGAHPYLAIASTVMPARAFLDAFVKSKGVGFETANKTQIDEVKAAIADAEKTLAQIDAKVAKGRPLESPEIDKLQNELLKKNVVVGERLSTLMGRAELNIKDIRERYLLEGLTGTYGSMPKPKGDNFTADHQPQAAVLIAAYEFGYFDEKGQLFTRKENRAKQGYAINLHKIRHMAGATFGGKGTKTKEDFNRKVAPLASGKKKQEQRDAVVTVLRQELTRDVDVMQGVANPDSAFWTDLSDKKQSGLDEADSKTLIGEVSKRIIAGENQIKNQDIDSLSK